MNDNVPDVDCSVVFSQMYAFFDSELDEHTLLLVQHHLNACEECEETYSVEERIRITIRRSCCTQAPDSLRAKIEKIRQITRE